MFETDENRISSIFNGRIVWDGDITARMDRIIVIDMIDRFDPADIGLSAQGTLGIVFLL